jgi:hypothetical protein
MSRYGFGPYGAYGNDLVGRGHHRVRGNDIVGDALAAMGLGNAGAADAAVLQHPMVQAAVRGAAQRGIAHGRAQAGGSGQGMDRNAQLSWTKSRPGKPLGINTLQSLATGLDVNKQVPASGTATLRVTPSVPLRPLDFHVQPPIAPFFLVMGIDISMAKFLPSSDGVMASFFLPDAVRGALNFPVVAPGTYIELTLLNIDAVNAHSFYGAFPTLIKAGPSDLTEDNPDWYNGMYR